MVLIYVNANNTRFYSFIAFLMKRINKNFVYKNDILFGKKNLNDALFDTILFASRTITEFCVPSFIKYIGSSSFNSCVNLNSIEFEENSQLVSIGKKSFENTHIQKIVIPKHVKEIEDDAFKICFHLKKIEFCEDSELESIGSSAFFFTKISHIQIPKQVKEIREMAFNFPHIKSVEFLSDVIDIKNNLKFFNSEFILSFPNAQKVIIEYDSMINMEIDHLIFVNPGAEIIQNQNTKIISSLII